MTRSRVIETSWIVKFVMWLLLVLLILFALPGSMQKVSAANLTKEQEKELREMFLEMLVTTDKTPHDVSKYKFDDFAELKNIFDDVCANEGALASYCYTFAQISPTWDKKYVLKVKVYYQEYAEDFQKNYATITENVDDIMSGITDDMTEADKALYLHDRIVDMTSYSKDKLIYGYAGGPLIFGYGSCTGYTAAYNYLLKRVGIKAGIASGNKHEWSVVQLDGKWYNVDTTWDHTRSDGIIGRKFFLKSDDEFKNYPVVKDRHLNFTSYDENDNRIKADSNTYSDIFIHDVSDVLFFEDGLWYYTDKNGELMAGKLTDKEAHAVNFMIGGSQEEENEIEAPVEEQPTETVAEPGPEIVEPVIETQAKYFLCKGDRTDYRTSNYIKLGKGTITKEERVKDDEDAILANLGKVPSYDEYLGENQRVCWYSIKKENDGWHVDGQIVTEENTVEEPVENIPEVSEETPETPVEETVVETPVEPVVEAPESEQIVETKAMFYLCKGSRTDYRASNYIKLGAGTITKTERIKDDEDAILKAIGNMPSYDKYLEDGKRVCWYSIKKEGDGWHVDGQIVSIE